MKRWKICPGFPDYEVSDHGDVRRSSPGRGARVGTICKPWTDPDGRVTTSIRKDGKTVTVRIASLVCAAFVGERPGARYECCHGDGNPQHNHWENLRWDTSAGNKADMIAHGTRLSGEKAPMSKLTEREVRVLRRLWQDGRYRQREIADIFEVRQSTISKIVTGKRWSGAA
jgi:hypothetical protein